MINGALAQLVERLAGSEEVRGSTPLGSTKFPYFIFLIGAETGYQLGLKIVTRAKKKPKIRSPIPTTIFVSDA